ncbi:MAG TPA: DUF2970 domain-containing protein [Burkholderiaceae bacterium]|jgi:hypothetical protein|nr:DUF2970 domain-containing protein [Burkholderiaceae bacterium]
MDGERPKDALKRKVSFAQTMRAIAWAFFGVRKGAEHDKDMSLNPVHVIIAALIGAAIFIGALVLIVRAVVG